MRPVEVRASALDGMRATLLTAAQDLDGCGSSAPGSVDAGPWTSMITSMMAKVTTATAAVAEGIAAASQGVGDSAASYDNADAAARTNLTPSGR